jgi:hypothetical protein
MILCPSCGQQVLETSVFCDQCGRLLLTPQYYTPTYFPLDLAQQAIQLLAQLWNQINPAEHTDVLHWAYVLTASAATGASTAFGAYWGKVAAEKLRQWLEMRRREQLRYTT